MAVLVLKAVTMLLIVLPAVAGFGLYHTDSRGERGW